jgi:hypothetical protein
MEDPIRIKELGDMAPEMPAAQTSPKSDRLSSEAVLGILSSFPRKPLSTKVEDNLVAHKLDTEFALFRVRTWEIWCRQGRAANQENLDETEFMETKFASLPRKISCKVRWSTPQDSQGYKYKPLGAPRGGTMEIHSPESRRKKEIHRRKQLAAANLRGYLGDGLGHT